MYSQELGNLWMSLIACNSGSAPTLIDRGDHEDPNQGVFELAKQDGDPGGLVFVCDFVRAILGESSRSLNLREARLRVSLETRGDVVSRRCVPARHFC